MRWLPVQKNEDHPTGKKYYYRLILQEVDITQKITAFEIHVLYAQASTVSKKIVSWCILHTLCKWQQTENNWMKLPASETKFEIGLMHGSGGLTQT